MGDISGDGAIEMVLGLTDRIVRSYRWVDNMDSSQANSFSDEGEFKISGNFFYATQFWCLTCIFKVNLFV